MRLGVVGSRTFTDYDLLVDELDKIVMFCPIEVIISGGASGADSLAQRYAKEFGIKLVVYLAKWNNLSEPCITKTGPHGTYNALAGMNRNTKIVEASDMIVAFWDGRSRGTLDTIKKAKEMGKDLKVVRF